MERPGRLAGQGVARQLANRVDHKYRVVSEPAVRCSAAEMDAGRVIYVAVGSIANDSFDSYSLDYTINRVAPCELPLRDADLITTYTVSVPQPSGNAATDQANIQAKLNSAKSYRAAHPTENV